MLVFSKFSRIYMLAFFAIFLFQIGVKMAPSQVPQRAETSSAAQPIRVVIRTDHGKYSLADTVKLDVSLQNTGDATAYVDRRMFWGGFGGGLKLEIADEQGKPVPAHMLNDAIMPPPKVGDTSILIRLDQGFFYGTGLDLPVKDHFPKAGKYSIRVIYKSWLRKEFVAPQLRELPALWAEAPEIASEPVWIEIGRDSAANDTVNPNEGSPVVASGKRKP
jgi:hypothetical protein